MSVRPILPTNASLELPPRVKRKIEIYKQKGLEYLWQRDTRSTAREETAFYQLELFDAQREKPTLLTFIHAIYRVKDSKGDEWLVWRATKILRNRINEEESFNDLYGIEPNPIPHDVLDNEGRLKDRTVSATLPSFTTPWSPENFQNILQSSTTEVTDFYVVPATNDYFDPLQRNVNKQACGNTEDFIEGTYDELYNMPFKGYTRSKARQLPHYRAQVARERILLDNSAKVVAQAEEQITKKGK